jgi:flagellar assembly factor FliW
MSASPTLTISSRRFGDLELAPTDLIEFPEGLVGLGGSRYVVVSTDDQSPFRWLQSADDPDLALPVTDPWTFFSEYQLELSDDATAAAGLPERGDDVTVWVTVRASGKLEEFSANLRAPIVVHEGRGHQVINETADAPVRARLFTPEQEKAAA